MCNFCFTIVAEQKFKSQYVLLMETKKQLLDAAFNVRLSTLAQVGRVVLYQ